MNYQIIWGKSDDIALVIAGVHGSEISGIEVANWIAVKLKKQRLTDPPLYTTILVPEIYPEQAFSERDRRIRANFRDEELDSNAFRNVKLGGQIIATNRQFPVPGEPSSTLKDRTAGGQPLLPETKELLRLIELCKPKRIASIHAHRIPAGKPTKGTDWPGVFVDPRYVFDKRCLGKFKVGWFDTNACKFDLAKDPATKDPGRKQFPSSCLKEGQEDDQLAYNIALDVMGHGGERLIPGNHLFTRGTHVLDKVAPVVHYTNSSEPADPGFSLGDWAPVTVGRPGDPEYRPGCPVLTVEVFHYFESWAWVDGEQFHDEDGALLAGKRPPTIPGRPNTPFPFNRQRSHDLQLYADAIIAKFLKGPAIQDNARLSSMA